MQYRAILCDKCGKITPMNLDVEEKCECGGENKHGWQVEDTIDNTPYTCFKVNGTVKELFSTK